MEKALTADKFKKLINIDEWQFGFGQRNEHRLLMADLWGRALFSEHAKQALLPLEPQDTMFCSPTKAYIKKAQREAVIGAIREACSSGEYSRYVAETTQKVARDFEAWATSTASQLRQIERSRTVLGGLWRDFDAQLLVVIPWFYIPWYIAEENIVTDRVRAGLTRHTDAVRGIVHPALALPILVTPKKRMLFQDEQRDFFTFVAAAEQYPTFAADAQFLAKADAYLASHAWMTTFAFLPLEPLTRPQLLDRVRTALQNNARADYEQQERRRAADTHTAQQLMDVLENDQKLLADVEGSRTLGWALTWSVEVVLRAAARLQPFYKLVARTIGVSWSDLSHLTSAEIVAGLEGSLPVPKEELERRRQGYAFVNITGQASFVTGSEALEVIRWLKETLETAPGEVAELRGQPVSPGKARGPVKVCAVPKDAEAMPDGGVLVCSMTSPDYVLAMKRAGAIVTDEGGLLSHASIVSRELGKPCVTATKHASRVLRDGDQVEVDGEKGIVRILRRAAS